MAKKGFIVVGGDEDTGKAVMLFLDAALTQTPSCYDAIVACRAVANALVSFLAERQGKTVEVVEAKVAEGLALLKIEQADIPEGIASGTVTRIKIDSN